MNNFDICQWLLEQAEDESSEIEQNQNNNMVQTNAVENQNQEMGNQAPPENTPAQMSSQTKNAFRDVIGGTISDISYERVGAVGGKLTIKTSNSHIPLVVSWVNTKVSVQQPDGNVIVLSGK